MEMNRFLVVIYIRSPPACHTHSFEFGSLYFCTNGKVIGLNRQHTHNPKEERNMYIM